MRYLPLLVKIFIILALLRGVPVQAENPTDANAITKHSCTRPLQIAASPIGRSMIISPEGKISGSTHAFFELLEKDTGCHFEYLIVPRARALHMLEQGQIDMVTTATRAPERDQVARFIKMTATAPLLISLHSKNLKLASVAELIQSPVTLIVFNGHYWGNEYRDLLAHPMMQGRISATSTPELALKMLLYGRADAILGTPAMMVDAWEQAEPAVELEVHKLAGLPEQAIGLYMSKSKMSAQDMDLIATAIAALIKRGDFDKLLKTYYPPWAIETLKSDKPSNKPSKKPQK